MKGVTFYKKIDSFKGRVWQNEDEFNTARTVHLLSKSIKFKNNFPEWGDFEQRRKEWIRTLPPEQEIYVEYGTVEQ